MSRYLITFDMDTNCLKDNYHGNSYNNAYADIKNILAKHGFENIQGSVYLGREGISEAHGTILSHHLHDGRTHQPVWADRKAWTV